MNRRSLFLRLGATALTLRALSAWADQKPWVTRLLSGPMDDRGWLVGLEIKMQPHWKTYWRVPGQGGVPPFMEAKGDNVKSFEVLCPTPTRLRSQDGEAIGYMENAMFLLRVTAMDTSKAMAADVSAFVGVCMDICIPAQFSGQIVAADQSSMADLDSVRKWNALVPVVTKDLVTEAKALMVDGKPAVRFKLSRPLQDVFVEGNDAHYFKAPQFDGTSATLHVAGAKSLEDVRKTPLRVTGKLDVGGLEQMVTVV
jgi:DsbC/DsbD-like thiol-disulfide interchange protein